MSLVGAENPLILEFRMPVLPTLAGISTTMTTAVLLNWYKVTFINVTVTEQYFIIIPEFLNVRMRHLSFRELR